MVKMSERPHKPMKMTIPSRRGLYLILIALFWVGCGDQHNDVTKPVFTNPTVKTASVASSAFTTQLYNEAVAYEPLLARAGTQVNMGFWSASGNHGSLVRVLDAINGYTPAAGESVQKAIWDEGAQSSLQYPAYVTMLAEHWYERKDITDGKVMIYGILYTDPFTVTLAIADEIWGKYSQRYADMAALFRQVTGKPVKVWCFVEGAKSNRIFFTYEFPELQTLEQSGDVQVFFAKTQDADWTDAADWTEGTQNAPTPVQADITLPEDIEHAR